MNPSTLEIGLADLRKFFPVKDNDTLSNDFFISEVRYKESLDILRSPCRFDGYLALFCVSGSLHIELNLKKYEVLPNSLVIIIPGTIGRVDIGTESQLDGLRFVAVAVSREFISSARVDFVRLFNESLTALSNPCIRLSEEELQTYSKFYELIQALMRQNPENIRDILRHLLSSVLFYAGSTIAARKGEVHLPLDSSNASSRAKLTFEAFLKLVADYHTTERGMAFYAEKLCLTPKYLSKLIKQVSGKSGPEWISSFVVIEAKNMLKYSEMPVKEIVYRLNFPNSSVFYKFFKAHTGMTPTEYRG